MANVTRQHADKIAKKLMATLRDSGPHTLAVVYVNGIRVTQFGIRRGSNKDAGHDHIPADLGLSARNARLLGECPYSRDAWIAEMRRQGLLPPESDPKDDTN